MVNCPNCGHSYYTVHYSTCTALGWTPVYKDGVEISSNPNTTTTYCTCCVCNHDFYFEEQFGEVQKTVDQGEKPEVPVLQVPINDLNEENCIMAKDKLIIPSSNFETAVTIPTSKDIERLETKLDKLAQKVEEILRGL